MAFECPDGFELLFGEGEQLPKLPDRANGVLRLPSPIVPLGFGNVAPERVAPRFTGRLFFLRPAEMLRMGRRPEPGTLIRFVHRARCLQKTRISGTPAREQLSGVCRNRSWQRYTRSCADVTAGLLKCKVYLIRFRQFSPFFFSVSCGLRSSREVL